MGKGTLALHQLAKLILLDNFNTTWSNVLCHFHFASEIQQPFALTRYLVGTPFGCFKKEKRYLLKPDQSD